MSTPFLRASRPFLVVAALLPLVASHPVPPTLAVEHATGRRPAIEPNRGQFGPDVAFALRAAGGRVSFAAGRVELPGEAALGFGFLGGADPGTLEPVEPSPGLVHYVAGSDPEGWVTGVPTFGGLLRRGVYPGVDVLFRGGPAGLELELVLAPWADPSAVVLDFGRAGAFRLDGEGAAILESGAEAVRIGQPALGTLLPAGGTVALHLNRGSGDASAPVHVHLSIDILVPPGRGLADLPRLATGAGGDVFVAGSLGGVELDARSARRGEHRGHPHRGARELQPGDAPLAERTGAFVSRVSGETVLETAWFGESMERPEAIATTPEGDVVLVGERGEDAFVLRLSRSGLRPIAEAAIGGAGEDVAQALAVDDGGEIWVAGRTASADLPVTDDALQAHPGGRTDGWVAHLDAALSVTSLTYLGGRGDDEATALAFDGNGTLHIAGTTTSADFPVRSPLQAFGGGRDAFLATLDPATGALRQATCYGADGDETPLGLAVHRGGDVLLLGKDAQPFLVRVAGDGSAVLQTVRLELPAAALALDPAGRIWIAGTLEGEEDGLTDAFVARLVPETFAPEETHLLAGDREDRAGALLLDARGRALLAGLTRSDELPGTTRTESTASGDVFLARIVPDTEAPQGTCPGDTHWVGPASGEDWATAANWSAGVPTATTDACIQNAAVIVSTAGQTAKSLRVEGGGAALTISGAGSLTLANASEIDAPFTLSSGTLTGDGSLTLSGLFTWGGGTMGGTGTTTANGGIAFTTAAEKTLTRTLIHSVGQNAVLSGTGPLMINSPGVLSNLGIFEHQTDASVTGSGTFDNAGSFLRTTSVGTAQISLGFTNSGTLEALSGDLHFTGPSLVQTAGSTTVNGGTITNAAPLLIQGGTLRGTGTITGSVSNTGGAVSPGLSPGTLNLVGGYTQGPGGDLTLELGGLTAGTEHDWLTLTNPGFGSVDAALDGSLTVSLVNGFAPAIGDSFTVLTGDTRTGTFATTNLPAFGCGKTWNVQYNATTVVLEVVAQPGSSDLVITPFVAPDPVAAGDPVTYSPKVGNSGPDDATQVTLTTTLPAGATFVSASSGCSEAGGIVTCAMGTIPAGSGSSAEIVVTFAAPGGPSFSSSVTSAECDPNPTDNTDRTISLIVLPACPDDDGDGYAVCSTGVACLPTGGDQCGDCDDSNGDVHPGAAEQCNGVDDDCTNGVPADEADDDTDGFRVCDGDCDDLDGNVHPGATEQCNGIDDDCADGIPADEGDGDGDGSRVCAGDCNDANPNVHPGVLEQCNGEDDDCDGNVPATEANGDDDGFRICDGDCDDGNPGVRPDAPETCDGLDTNCDGSIPADEDDGDGDGYRICQNDCDDTDETVNPGVVEDDPFCTDGVDNDCDGTIDLDDATCLGFCPDGDGDGYALCDATCILESGDQCGDCDDGAAGAHPGANEVCNGIDDDCVGGIPANEADGDADGFRICQNDCNDGDADVNPGATEQCNGVDDDCVNGAPGSEADADSDGFRVCENDCNDNNGSIHPGATEQCNGVDDDCTGGVPASEADSDGDGARVCAGDCNDGDAAIHPGAVERCNGLDDDCTGGVPANEADGDEDGVRLCGNDCDDADPDVNPLVSESGEAACGDSIDNDCDGNTDLGDLGCAVLVTSCATLGDQTTGTIDEDVFTLVGHQNETVTIALSASAAGSGRADLVLIDAMEDAVDFFRIDRTTLPNQISVTLPANGPYRIAVREHPAGLLLPGSPFRGAYCLSVDASAGAAQTLVPTSSVEGVD